MTGLQRNVSFGGRGLICLNRRFKMCDIMRYVWGRIGKISCHLFLFMYRSLNMYMQCYISGSCLVFGNYDKYPWVFLLELNSHSKQICRMHLPIGEERVA